MNKRIRRKKGLLAPKVRWWPPMPAVKEYVPPVPVADMVFNRRSFYSSVDLSWMRRHPRNYVNTHEHRRVEAARRRRMRHLWQRTAWFVE